MIAQGLVLMVVGMLTVFAFLTLLVFAMGASAAFFSKFAHLFPDPEPTGASKPKKHVSSNDADIAVAIAAVKAFTK